MCIHAQRLTEKAREGTRIREKIQKDPEVKILTERAKQKKKKSSFDILIEGRGIFCPSLACVHKAQCTNAAFVQLHYRVDIRSNGKNCCWTHKIEVIANCPGQYTLLQKYMFVCLSMNVCMQMMHMRVWPLISVCVCVCLQPQDKCVFFHLSCIIFFPI